VPPAFAAAEPPVEVAATEQAFPPPGRRTSAAGGRPLTAADVRRWREEIGGRMDTAA